MAEPYMGQIVAVGFNFAPQGWAICDGSLLQIADCDVLFNLIGTTFGGDGHSTFALPDLRGRVVVAAGQGPGLSAYGLGQRGGVESVALASGQVGAHAHALAGAAMSTTQTPSPSVVLGATPAADPIYATAGTSAALVPGAVSPSGGGAAHENRQPSLAITYIISLFGIYPGGVEAGDGRRLTLVAVEVPRIPRADPPARVGFTLVLRGDPSPVTPEGALEEPRRLGLPARVTVLMTNAASLGLCERLGFVRRNETPPFVELEWRPGP